MLQMLNNTTEARKVFAKRSAKAWQNYFDTKGLLPDITLSPEQLAVVQQDEDQLLINGSAGSGKSITLLYKLLKVMEQESERKRILYCSFNLTLIEDARKRYHQSSKYEELNAKHTLHMNTFHYMAARLLKEIGLSQADVIRTNLNEINRHEDNMKRRTMILMQNFMDSKEHQELLPEQRLYQTHRGSFLMDEILWMKANGYITEEKYCSKETERSGRGQNPRLTFEQRKIIFQLYKKYHEMRDQQFHGRLDLEDYALLLLKHMEEIPESLKYDYIFVDEVQDLQPMQLKSLVLLTKKSIILSGDTKQRIYKRSTHSYRELGLEIEGRKNRKLRTNYRSTKEIMNLASSIKFIDVEHDREDDQKFVREGPKPEIRFYKEYSFLNRYLIKQIKEIREVEPKASIAIIHRYDGNLNGINRCPVRLALSREFALISTEQYGRRFDYDQIRKPIFYTDAFSVKGLEFDYVFILHFDREHFPNKARIDELAKQSNGDMLSKTFLQDEAMIRNDEKKLLYVSLTRAKQKAVLLYVGKNEFFISPFVRDFESNQFESYGFSKTKFTK